MGQPEWSVLAHEFGHNLGVGHTHSPGCSVAPFQLCAIRRDLGSGFYEYGGRDLMGWGTGMLPSPYLVALGLIRTSQVESINLTTARATTVSLAPLSAGKGTLAVKLRWKKEEVWLSYDMNDGFTTGIQVHTVRSRRVFELPVDTSGAAKSPGLLAGGTYPLPRGRVTVTSIGDTAKLTVDFGALPGVKVIPGEESADVRWDSTSLAPEDDLVVRVFSPDFVETFQGDGPTLNSATLNIRDVSVKAGTGHLNVDSLSPSTGYRLTILHNGEPLSAPRPFRVRPNSARFPEWTLDMKSKSLNASFRPSSDAFSIEYVDVFACRVTKTGSVTTYNTMHQRIRDSEVAYLDWTPRTTGVTAWIHFEDGTTVEQVLVKSAKAGTCPSNRDY